MKQEIQNIVNRHLNNFYTNEGLSIPCKTREIASDNLTKELFESISKEPTEKELLNDIDDLLARFEDFTHGKDGDEITQLRKRISQIPNIYSHTPKTNKELEKPKPILKLVATRNMWYNDIGDIWIGFLEKDSGNGVTLDLTSDSKNKRNDNSGIHSFPFDGGDWFILVDDEYKSISKEDIISLRPKL